MGRSKFVQPEVLRLNLTDGEWIDVKKELNVGEARAAHGRLYKPMHFGERAEIDPEQVGLAKTVAYIVGWSLTNSDGKPEPFSEEALLSLSVDVYQEIEKAVDAHETKQDAEREARKNATGEPMKSSETSPSAV